MMMAEAGASLGPSVQPSRCSLFPEGRVVAAPPSAGLLKTFQAVVVSIMSRPAYRPAGDTPYRISFFSTCQKRGPPRLLLA